MNTQSRWYRLPEDEPRDDSQAMRGGSRGRGRRGRGRGTERQVQDPRCARQGAETPYHMHAMGQHPFMQAAHEPNQYYHNPAGIEEMPPHWQFVEQPLRSSHKNYNQGPITNMQGYQRFPRIQPGHQGYPQYYNQMQDHYLHFFNMSPTHPPYPAQINRNSFPQSPGYHHMAFQHPAHTFYGNLNSKGRQRFGDKRSDQQGHRTETGKTAAIQVEDFKEPPLTQHANLQMPEVLESACKKLPIDPPYTHQLTQRVEFLKNQKKSATIIVDSEPPQKTLAETAAFLHQPQFGPQQFNNLASCRTTQQKGAIYSQILEDEPDGISTIKTCEPPQAHQSEQERSLNIQGNSTSYPTDLIKDITDGQEEIQDLSFKHGSPALSAQTPDYKKYTELSLSLPIEPPPAHQNKPQTEKFPKYLDMHTPPLAHQAPISQMPARPQSARTVGTVSPSKDHVHSGQIGELQTICLKQTPKRKALKTVNLNYSKKSEDDILANTHTHVCQSNDKSADGELNSPSVYQSRQMLSGPPIVYQTSPDTFASEQVVYQPQIDMFTKEQIVYQPREKKFSATKVIYQPRTDYLAAAEAVYQPDMIAARKLVIQPKAGTINASETVYNTNQIMMPAEPNNSQADMAKTSEALYRQQIEILAARQAAYQTDTSLQTTSQQTKAKAKRSGKKADMYVSAHQSTYQENSSRSLNENAITKIKPAPILRNLLSNELGEEESQESERNMAVLRQLLQENYNNVFNSMSNLVTPNQSLRQTRKRKITPTQTDWLAALQQTSATHQIHQLMSQNPSPESISRLLEYMSPGQLVPARSASSSQATNTATNMQSLIALNWTLQRMELQQRVLFPYIRYLLDIIKNHSNSMDKSQDK